MLVALSELPVAIAAYRPEEALLRGVVAGLRAQGFRVFYLVDDGSGDEYYALFVSLASESGVHLLRHPANRGKGAALKTAFAAILQVPTHQGVICVDADGQHDPVDAKRVAETFLRTPSALVLGVRDFRGAIPFRSRLGNEATSALLKLLFGRSLRDTQTGLRAIPRALLATWIHVPANRYEFEMETLLRALREKFPLEEVSIPARYEPGNPTSHFRPLQDSVLILSAVCKARWR